MNIDTDKEEREKKLPKWAQNKLHELRRVLNEKDRKIETLESITSFPLENHNWFALHGPPIAKGPDETSFFILSKNSAQLVFTLLEGDMVFIGRKKNRKYPKKMEESYEG